MLATIFTVVFGIIIAYFATQNTAPVSIHINDHTWSGIPLYFIVLASFLIGLLFAWLISLLNMVSSSLELRRKQKELDMTNKALAEHAKKVRELQLENVRLQAKQEHPAVVTVPVHEPH